MWKRRLFHLEFSLIDTAKAKEYYEIAAKKLEKDGLEKARAAIASERCGFGFYLYLSKRWITLTGSYHIYMMILLFSLVVSTLLAMVGGIIEQKGIG